jgi:uncharacterized membrane protein YdfJ with MMPL/SSD domain
MVLAAAVVVAALAALFGAGLTSRLSPVGLTSNSSESGQADTLIGHATGHESPPGVIALLSLGPPGHPRKGSVAATMEELSKGFKIHQLEEAIESDHEVGEVRSALDVGESFLSRNHSLASLTVGFRSGSEQAHLAAARHLAHVLRHWPNLKLGGPDLGAVQAIGIIEREVQEVELLSFPIFLLLLIWFFRGLTAALLPMVLGGSAIVLTSAGLRLATSILPISAPAFGFTTALGLGLAIDYSLLIVSRFREELELTPEVPHALERTMATAGRTVLFSASTVVVALGSLLVLPQPYFYSMGLGGAIVAALVCLAALTVLPALLALLGPRVNGLSPTWLQRSAHVAARPMLSGRWYRLASAVMRRPLIVAVCACGLMLAFGAPALGIKFNAPGSSVLPTSTSVRQVSDTLAADFKLNPEHTVEIVTVHATNGQLTHYRRALERLPGTISTSTVQHLKAHTAVIYLISAGNAASAQAQRLVQRIRDLRVPFERKVGGFTAIFMDLQATLDDHILIIALLVGLTTSISIFLLTGSVVLPLKTLLMNALVVCAALGALVLVFQHSFLHELLGYPDPGAIEVAQPALLLAVVFALSTDYGVFLIARIREIHDAGASNEQAIALGLERTGRITTTAALLLCAAIGALLGSQLVDGRELGVGIITAVLLDATVVRALLVPALMRLLGEANWWSPAPLRHLHRRIRPLEAPVQRALLLHDEAAGTAPSQQPTD